ncbi:LysR family transcriptional regulator [Gymnodinialimonas hymeniacidonis]|uniref:LysR family transcriptional regulator n=1 Tax=Gymnodinialimonas hymeniacidonis TaxID=3126508 RepID=UPI0034C69658
MPNRLPSLTSLRTFEAAARNLSFAKAADELFVTPAAVGFQIKQLEQELGGPLFLRKHRAIELTDKGQVLQKRLGRVFETIQTAWSEAREPLQETVLKVSGPAKALHSWVMPSLAAAKGDRPDIRMSWDLSKQNRDLADTDFDMVVRWADEPLNEHHWIPLLRTWFTPLMRPDVARFVRTPQDVGKQGLIGVEFATDPKGGLTNWAAWHNLHRITPPTSDAVSCADTASAVETAIATGHIAIGGSFLAWEHLKSGALVAPFDTAVTPFSRFWLVCREGMQNSPEYHWFLDAVLEGARRFDAAPHGISLYFPDGKKVQ